MPNPSIYGSPVERINMSFKKVTDRLLSAVVQSIIPIVASMQIIAETFIMNTMKMFIGKIKAKSAVSPPMYVRLLWIDNNPGEVFDKNNPYHILQLTDMYLQINEDWTQDPLLKIQATTPAYLHWHRINAGTAREISKRSPEDLKALQDQKKAETKDKIAKAKEAAKQAALKNEAAAAEVKVRSKTPAPPPSTTTKPTIPPTSYKPTNPPTGYKPQPPTGYKPPTGPR